MTITSEILAIIGTINAVIYGYLVTEIRGIRADLKKMVLDSTCQERKASCAKAWCHEVASVRAELKDVWTVIDSHSHEGLGVAARIIRDKGK